MGSVLEFNQHEHIILSHILVPENTLTGSISKVSKTLYYVNPMSLDGVRIWEPFIFKRDSLLGAKGTAKGYKIDKFDTGLHERVKGLRTIRMAKLLTLREFKYQNVPSVIVDSILSLLEAYEDGNSTDDKMYLLKYMNQYKKP